MTDKTLKLLNLAIFSSFVTSRFELWQDCFMTDLIMTVLAQNRQIKFVIKLGAKVCFNRQNR